MKLLPSKGEVLSRSESLFREHFGHYEEGEYYVSPFRNDTIPSFNIFEGKDGIMYYKDWGTGESGTIIDFMMKLFNINYKEALTRSAVSTYTNKKKKRKKEEVNISPIIVPFDEIDKNYWNLLGVDIDSLNKYNVYAASDVFINGNHFTKKDYRNPVYALFFYYKGARYTKIYRPFAPKTLKWRTDMEGVVEKLIGNLHNIPDSGDLLIITKSMKDNIIFSELGYNCISTQGESLNIDKGLIEHLKNRFKKIVLFYDNDYNKSNNPGVMNAKRLAKIHNISYIYLEDRLECTDIAELAVKIRNNKILKLNIEHELQRSKNN